MKGVFDTILFFRHLMYLGVSSSLSQKCFDIFKVIVRRAFQKLIVLKGEKIEKVFFMREKRFY